MQIKGQKSAWSLQSSLEELERLARTAGAEVVGTVTQRLDRPEGSHYLGKGKLEELAKLREKTAYTMVIADDELSPTQERNLEKALGDVKILDRTSLILDIFAKQARTREGKIQVDLAQHEYVLPRLAGRWRHLERLGGGIGTRGPGETQIETDRRLIAGRIKKLKENIEDVRRHRTLYRERRAKEGIPVIALVGYTNAGKSTLLNALSKAGVQVEDKLFTTLDPTTRRIMLPNGQPALVTDTVGFIQKLPVSLVASFRATLEEMKEADLLLHVIDITHKNAAEQSDTVERILAEMGLGETSGKPKIAVLNKIDRFEGNDEEGQKLAAHYTEQFAASGTPAVVISAARGWGLDKLLKLVSEKLGSKVRKPASAGESS